MDIAIDLCTGGSVAFVLGGCGYYYLFRREKKDKLLDGPTPGSTVCTISVRSGSMIDHVDFVFTDGFIASHGGDGGNRMQDFIINPGETISCVRGRCGDSVDSMQFVLSSGRVSPIYGGPGGSTAYSFDINEAIGGLSISLSARGWFNRISGVWSVGDMTVPREVAHASRRHRDDIRRHKIQHHMKYVIPERRRYLLSMFIIVFYYLACLFPVLTLYMGGGMSLEKWMDEVAAPAVSTELENNEVWRQWQQKSNQDTSEWDPNALTDVVNDALRSVVKKYGGYVRLPDIPQYDRNDGSWQVSGEWHELCMSRGNVEHQWLMIPYQQSKTLVSAYGTKVSEGVNDKVTNKLSGASNLILVQATRESVGKWSLVYISERVAFYLREVLWFNFGAVANLNFPDVHMIADDVGGSEVSPYLRYGMIRVFQLADWGTDEDQRESANMSAMPVFYVDTSFQPFVLFGVYMLLQLCFGFIMVELVLLIWGSPWYNPVYACLMGYTGQQETLGHVVDAIERELSDVESVTEVKWGKNTILCSANWLIVFRQFSMDAVQINDIMIESVKLVLRYSGSEPVEVTVLKIARNLNGHVRRFTLECPRDAFPRLRNAVVVQRRERALKAVKLELEAQLLSEWRRRDDLPSMPHPPCLGECGALANVRIVKRCTTCEERDECRCDPAWCHECILKWWIEKNTTKLEMGTTPTLAWQTRCPTCRVFFCLRDLAPTGPLESENNTQNNTRNDTQISPASQTLPLPLQRTLAQHMSQETEEKTEEITEEKTEEELEALAIALSLEPQPQHSDDAAAEVLTEATPNSASAGPASESELSVRLSPSPSAAELRAIRLARFDSS